MLFFKAPLKSSLRRSGYTITSRGPAFRRSGFPSPYFSRPRDICSSRRVILNRPRDVNNPPWSGRGDLRRARNSAPPTSRSYLKLRRFLLVHDRLRLFVARFFLFFRRSRDVLPPLDCRPAHVDHLHVLLLLPRVLAAVVPRAAVAQATPPSTAARGPALRAGSALVSHLRE